jgi:transposase
MGKSRYEESYKQEVVELSYRRDSIKALAAELSIDAALIYRWRRERLEQVTPAQKAADGTVSREELLLELRRLARANKELEEDNEILKKAIDIFSPRNRKSSL